MRILQNKYYNYKELEEILFACEKEYPDLVEIFSIGKSHEGRELWVMALTNKKTGRHEDKPAMLLSANVHAGEVSGTQVCLYEIDYMLNNYGTDPEVTRIIDKRTMYIFPRINPDGAEAFINTESEQWGNAKHFPNVDGCDGLKRMDVDGNGLLLLMRKKDPNGEWKISEKDPRLMIQRLPYEFDGEYYSIYPEGRLIGDNKNPDAFKILPREYQVNMNRNYPDGWDLGTSLTEGGEYPMSEPEIFAMANFFMSHKNIGTSMDMHTFGGVLLRGFCYKGDENISSADLELYNQFGAIATAISGYDFVNVYDKFTRPGDRPRRGSLADWAYEFLGIFSAATEIWNLAARAGVKRKDPNDYYPDRLEPEEDELKLLEFNDKYLDGKNFINWTPFNHPDLGEVELGGWNWKWTSKNPPLPFLEDECKKVAPIYLKQIMMLPEVGVKNCVSKKLSEDTYEILITVENGGYYPTYIMDKAVQNGIASPVKVELLPGEGYELLSGKAERSLGHLAGRIRKDRNFYFGDPASSFPSKAADARFIVKVTDADKPLNFAVKSDKGGNSVYNYKVEK